MAVAFNRSALRTLMEDCCKAVMAEYDKEHPPMYGPWTKEDQAVIDHNDRVVAAHRESTLDMLPNVDHSK